MNGYDLIAHLDRQRSFSLRAFGPGTRTKGVIDHIRKELVEVENAPGDLGEWIDVILLACDGAWRAGFEPQQIATALEAKLTRNENRQWPDWRTADPDKAIEHVRPTAPLETELVVVYWEWTEGKHIGGKFWAVHSRYEDGRLRDWPTWGLTPRAAATIKIRDSYGLELINRTEFPEANNAY